MVAGDEALTEFRQGLTGAHALDLLHNTGGRLLIQLAVGVGKTEWLAKIINHALTVDQKYDLIVVLIPRKDSLDELVNRLPPSLPRVVLKPRPQKRCGPLNKDWLEYESRGCSHLGRAVLCKNCPKLHGCYWPGQFGRRLRGARLVLATQQHLVLDPRFLSRVRSHAGAKSPLLLLDESDLLLRNTERTLTRDDLDAFLAAQRAVDALSRKPPNMRRNWKYLTELVKNASTGDLQAGNWKFPSLVPRWAVAVQREGRRNDAGFRFPAFDLHALTRSDRWSRERLPDGSLRFATLPDLGNDFIVFSGSIAKELLRYRIDPNHFRAQLESPFAAYRFEHPGTRWYNLACLQGAAKYFPGNAKAILDFFAALIARNLRAGKRTLLITRKTFVLRCRTYLSRRLAELVVGKVQIITGGWERYDLTDPRILPLINYGISGVNRFQEYDAAYCLTAYYVGAQAVAQVVQDIDSSDERYRITLDCVGKPPRRRARIALPDQRETVLPRIVQWALEQKEADVVVQAVGRVRPFTKPREIITFQAGELPRVKYTREFQSLAQARAHFKVSTARRATADDKAAQAQRLKRLGLSHSKIATQMGVSLSAVKRYVHEGRGHETFIDIL
jgi:hypothetical protein